MLDVDVLLPHPVRPEQVELATRARDFLDVERGGEPCRRDVEGLEVVLDGGARLVVRAREVDDVPVSVLDETELRVEQPGRLEADPDVDDAGRNQMGEVAVVHHLLTIEPFVESSEQVVDGLFPQGIALSYQPYVLLAQLLRDDEPHPSTVADQSLDALTVGGQRLRAEVAADPVIGDRPSEDGRIEVLADLMLRRIVGRSQHQVAEVRVVTHRPRVPSGSVRRDGRTPSSSRHPSGRSGPRRRCRASG